MTPAARTSDQTRTRDTTGTRDATGSPDVATPRSGRKRSAILDAAEKVFLAKGYLGTSMDEVAARSGVSKQTVYAHFGSKETLFVALVSAMTTTAGDEVHPSDASAAAAADDPGPYLQDYAERQMAVVLTPKLLALRRLVIGEVARFPDLARALYDSGPARAIESLAASIQTFADRGLLAVPDATEAATTFNWLVMGGPLNEVMLLGDAVRLNRADQRRHAAECVRIFLAAYPPE
jgi:AcrR family transcriptional regulator